MKKGIARRFIDLTSSSSTSTSIIDTSRLQTVSDSSVGTCARSSSQQVISKVSFFEKLLGSHAEHRRGIKDTGLLESNNYKLIKLLSGRLFLLPGQAESLIRTQLQTELAKQLKLRNATIIKLFNEVIEHTVTVLKLNNNLEVIRQLRDIITSAATYTDGALSCDNIIQQLPLQINNYLIRQDTSKLTEREKLDVNKFVQSRLQKQFKSLVKELKVYDKQIATVRRRLTKLNRKSIEKMLPDDFITSRDFIQLWLRGQGVELNHKHKTSIWEKVFINALFTTVELIINEKQNEALAEEKRIQAAELSEPIKEQLIIDLNTKARKYMDALMQIASISKMYGEYDPYKVRIYLRKDLCEMLLKFMPDLSLLLVMPEQKYQVEVMSCKIKPWFMKELIPQNLRDLFIKDCEEESLLRLADEHSKRASVEISSPRQLGSLGFFAGSKTIKHSLSLNDLSANFKEPEFLTRLNTAR